jgi:hypothetical protein
MTEKRTSTTRQRKNYPGDVRTPGTKDYAVILANLINYRNQLEAEKDQRKAVDLILKIAEKLQELGFKRQSTLVKNKVKRKVKVTYKDRPDRFEKIEQKKTDVAALVAECWKIGRDKHEEARSELKKEKGDE